ncbi:MAG: hypothetical protein ACREJU_05785 [Nitrospiraceae bacterium]
MTVSEVIIRLRVGFFSLIVMAMSLLVGQATNAETVAVKFAEGATHGFLTLRSASGQSLAQGELIQQVHAERVDSRLVFHFKDGSLHDERVSFSQEKVFTMLTYQLVQRGPSFPHSLDISMDRRTGEYVVRSRPGADQSEEVIKGRIDLPPDVSNGMTVALLRNLPPGKNHTVQFVAFTPEPKLIDLMLLAIGDETVMVGDLAKTATRYSLAPQLNAITRFFGTLLGKLPDDFYYHFWILTDEVPAFARFEGPLYLMGPAWRIELVSPRLPGKGDGQAVQMTIWSITML